MQVLVEELHSYSQLVEKEKTSSRGCKRQIMATKCLGESKNWHAKLYGMENERMRRQSARMGRVEGWMSKES